MDFEDLHYILCKYLYVLRVFGKIRKADVQKHPLAILNPKLTNFINWLLNNKKKTSNKNWQKAFTDLHNHETSFISFFLHRILLNKVVAPSSEFLLFFMRFLCCFFVLQEIEFIKFSSWRMSRENLYLALKKYFYS
jgi:hypothetical protein